MPAPATIDAFLEVLGKSELVEPERLRAFMEQAGGLSTAPRKLAARMVAAGLLTQFQAEQLLQGKYRGFTLGKYKVLERIGSGGHSTVYLCEHQVVRRRVAIKVLPTDRSESPAGLARFYREARAAGALDHPNLVKAHDIDQDNGLHFLVMDYVDGCSLQALVSRFGPLAIERAADYARQAANGLQAAHVAGLVHRDVKPANILLDRHGIVRVTDLGLARFFSDASDSLTLKFANNSILGTADYVAPEQALNSHDVDIRADIYGLGGTFYFLLTGQPLFPGGKMGQKLIWHQTRQPTPVRQLRPEVPEAMAAVVERMIEKDPARRYQTPAEVAEALAPWREVPVPPPAEVEMPRLSPAVRAAAVADADSRSSISLGPASGGSSLRLMASGSRPDVSLTSLSGTAVAPSSPRTTANAPTPLPAIADTAPAGMTPAVVAAPPQPDVVRPSGLLAEAARPSATPRPTSWSRLLVAVLLMPVAMLTGTGIRWLRNQSALNDPAPGPIVPTLTVSTRAGDYPSLAAALRAAPPGARIVLAESGWDEVLQLGGDGGMAANVHIEGRSPTGEPVTWSPPAGHPADQPLVQISEGAGLSLKGFTIHGHNEVQNLVSLAGPCAGLTIEDVQLAGFLDAGVVLHHCTGTADRPVTLRRLRACSDRAASAVVLEARDGESNRHVHILGCRLEGPYQAAVRISGPAMGVELRDNRIFQAANGLRFTRTTPPAPLDVTVVANVFCAIENAGLHFEALPPMGRGRVVLKDNVFACTAALVRGDDVRGPAPFSPPPSGNARDRASAEGDLPLHAVEADFTLPDDPADDAHFLRFENQPQP